jgi:hypothetical protein
MMITAVFYTAVFSGFIDRGIGDDNRGFLYSGFYWFYRDDDNRGFLLQRFLVVL